jgi:TPR repeat protein
MQIRRPHAVSLAFALFLAWVGPAIANHSLIDRVKDGPAAANTRESYRFLELGENSDDDTTKMQWYRRGKELADLAVIQDDGSAEAHFALFANWGRWLQTDGWLKNSYRLPAVWKELDRTLELDPNHPDALAAKGGMYLQLPRFLGGDVEKAVPLLVRSIELDPHGVGARLELADCYLHQHRPDAARNLAAVAMRLAVEQDKTRYIRRAEALLEEAGPGPQQTEAKR